jgi:hypothetical protein
MHIGDLEVLQPVSLVGSRPENNSTQKGGQRNGTRTGNKLPREVYLPDLFTMGANEFPLKFNLFCDGFSDTCN